MVIIYNLGHNLGEALRICQAEVTEVSALRRCSGSSLLGHSLALSSQLASFKTLAADDADGCAKIPRPNEHLSIHT